MRLSAAFAALSAAAFMAGAAQAQDPATDGQWRAPLTRMIVESASGSCPADVMAGDLLTACEEQIVQMAPALASLGAIESMTFLRAEGEGAEKVEVYEVAFASGQTLTWGIGGFADGKFSIAYVTG